MQPLFWKFWISLCAAMLAIGALTTGLLTQWQHFELHSATQADPRVLIHSVADQMERTLAQGEDPTPILLSNQLSEYGHTYLINPDGADWLERPIPSDMLGGEPASFEQSTTPPSILARAISLPDDGLHFMIFRFDKQSH